MLLSCPPLPAGPGLEAALSVVSWRGFDEVVDVM